MSVDLTVLLVCVSVVGLFGALYIAATAWNAYVIARLLKMVFRW